jgi:exodeoxyribonuclease-5
MLQKQSIINFENAVKNFLPFEVNATQNEAIHQLSEFILDQNERSIFILKGYAGTGKSNLISAFSLALPSIKWRSVLLAPTGRAAKVLSLYARRPAQTIHKKIFKKIQDSNGSFRFALAENMHRNTLFIVDEASMISIEKSQSIFENSLLENLFEYVYSGHNCKLIFVGDAAQLPPVGSVESFALNQNYLNTAFHLNLSQIELNEVVRQKLESGILQVATHIRQAIVKIPFELPKIACNTDIYRLSGEELEYELNNSISKYGEDQVTIITRSNKGCNLYNQHFRSRIKYFEEDLCAGDKIMVVKNNYFWLEENTETAFIANGDTAEITKIINRESIYGFNFCECYIKLSDYPDLNELRVKIITDCLYTDFPALTETEQKQLYQNVMEDMSHEPLKHVRSAYLRKSPYYNAMQVKFKYAITCHKAQGGQWPCVFVDIGFVKAEDLNDNFCRWLYTAITRSTEKVLLVNFPDQFFD